MPSSSTIPDAPAYESDRGLLLKLFDLPDPTYETPTELAAGIQAIGNGSENDPLKSHSIRYREVVPEYCSKDDGHTSSRVIDIVFRAHRTGYALHFGLPDERTSIVS